MDGQMWPWVEVSLAELLFFKHKTRGKMQFWIELAAPYTLANHNKINSNNTLPFIIFFKTPFLRWLESPLASMLVATSHVPYDVIKRYSTSPCHWTILFSSLSFICFNCVFCVRFFFHIILHEHSNHIELKLYSFY